MGDQSEYAWKAIKSYIDKYGVVRHQLESYMMFIRHSIPHIIQVCAYHAPHATRRTPYVCAAE